MVYFYYVYIPKKNASRKDINNYDEMAYKYVPTYGDAYYKGTMNDGTTSLSSDCEMASKIKKSFVKNFHATFDNKMRFNCHALKLDDDDLFKNSSKRPTFFKRPFLTMINFEVDRISLQKLEYEMYCTDYPVTCNFFK